VSNILFVKSSPRGDASVSAQVAQALVDELRLADPSLTVTVRDLARPTLPHIGEDFVSSLATPDEARSDAQRDAIALSDTLVQELFAADTVVIASSMINFGVSSTLKSWTDHIVRAGLTFRYDEQGVTGLVKGKNVYLVEARGGVYSEGPARANDFQESYLNAILGFIGMTDIDAIRVEGLAYGPEAAERAVSAALAKVRSFGTAA
jgi:FMN-dependent NADH-azoreductase